MPCIPEKIEKLRVFAAPSACPVHLSIGWSHRPNEKEYLYFPAFPCYPRLYPPTFTYVYNEYVPK
uniref:Uncharacterized protein n=1 Tax=Picea sitchensis TaxID=3332 RepID=A0A6B9XVJ6_PICSI|nr:hypothetical protein Q903MT_gene4029 [Picea sitchensis]